MLAISIILKAMIIAECILALVCLVASLVVKSALQFNYMPQLLFVFYNLEALVGIFAVIAEIGGGETFQFQVFKMNYVISLGTAFAIVVITVVIVYPGTKRISEIATRFTLDITPGKQLAIDADYNSGQITDDEVRIRCEDIEKLSRFYGMMDGTVSKSKWYLGIILACGLFMLIMELISANGHVLGNPSEAKVFDFVLVTLIPFWTMSFASIGICMKWT